MSERLSLLSEERRGWRPQLPRRGERARPVSDPIVEPHWAGRHVLAHFDSAGAPGVTADEAAAGRDVLVLVDEEGDDVTAVEPDVHAELSRAIEAVDAVIDGFLTYQATRTGEGTTILSLDEAPRRSFLLGLPRRGRDARAPARAQDLREPSGPLAFVAVDLLVVDGQSLLDTPLLERKRLLEAVVRPSDRVRVSVYTKPPVAQWLASWKSMGFEGAVLKAANSRYRPTTLSDEWITVTRMARR